MTGDLHVLAVILVVSLVTVGLRVTPFLAGEALSRNRYLIFLGRKMPVGVMVLLVAYTLKDEDFTVYPYGLPILISVLISVLLYWRTNNSLLSIGLGLACYMVAINGIL